MIVERKEIEEKVRGGAPGIPRPAGGDRWPFASVVSTVVASASGDRRKQLESLRRNETG